MEISKTEIGLARHCLDYALSNGAQKARVTLSKTLMNLIGILNGEVDKVSQSLDRSIQIQIFADGRFGSFSSNRLEKEGLESFILKAVSTVKMLEEDSFRDLPAVERLEKNAMNGNELGLLDTSLKEITPERRRDLSLASSLWSRKNALEKGFKLISEEGEYSDNFFDSLTLDSQGLYARHCETSFEIGFEITVEAPDGRHFSSYWWDAAPHFKDLQWEKCSEKALERAVAQIDPKEIEGGKYNVVVESECAGKLVTPLLSALGGYSLQQHNSFLEDSLGKQLFPEKLNIIDFPRTYGENGSRLFDSEGVATREMPIIQNGKVCTYFLNSYMAAKMGMPPTIEDATHVKLLPTGDCKDLSELIQKVRDGILICGFNGGNSNPATGNFSYGIEGFLFKDGKIVCPVREMLVTGSFLELWGNLIATADDARPCLLKLVPSLAFKDIDISA